MEGFLTPDKLTDFATMAALLIILVQFFKGAIDSLFMTVFKTTVQTKYVAYFFALGLMLIKAHMEGGVTLEGLPLLLVNAVILALACMKGYEEFTQAGPKAMG